MSRLYLVLHSVMMMVSAARQEIVREHVTHRPSGVFRVVRERDVDGELTEVQAHADENDQAKPGVEVGDEVNDGNDNISDGGEDAEDYVTGWQRQSNRSNSLSSSKKRRVILIKECVLQYYVNRAIISPFNYKHTNMFFSPENETTPLLSLIFSVPQT